MGGTVKINSETKRKATENISHRDEVALVSVSVGLAALHSLLNRWMHFGEYF